MSNCFHDKTGQRWDLSLNINAIRRVKNVTGINLLRLLDEPAMLTDLSADSIAFVDAIYCICKPQADSINVNDESFGEAFDGTVLESATSAFLSAVVDFFPGARRGTLQKVLDRAMTQVSQQEAKLQTALMDGTIDRAIDQAMADGVNSGESPVPPESIPAS